MFTPGPCMVCGHAANDHYLGLGVCHHDNTCGCAGLV